MSLIRPGFITTEFIVAADAASAEVIASAGPYAPYYEGYSTNTQLMRRLAGVPDDIARLVEKALVSDNPAPRYNAAVFAGLLDSRLRGNDEKS